MIRFSTLLTRAAAALALGSMLALAGCHRGSVQDNVVSTSTQQQFDMTVQSYKDGQFLLDGAALSPTDLGSHLAYLKDLGKLPKSVLLLPSDDAKIRKQHLQYMARLELDYGFIVYYDDKGKLVKISPVDTKPRELKDYHPPATHDTDEAPPPKDHTGTGY